MNDSTDNRLMLTGKLEVRYRKPVPIGEMIEVIGIPMGESGRTATARGELRDSKGLLLAEAITTMVQAPENVVTAVGFGFPANGFKLLMRIER